MMTGMAIESEEKVAEVDSLRQRIQDWRATRPHREPMPEPLWESAAELARGRGVYPICRALRLDYYALKKRVAQVRSKGQVRLAQPTFLEVTLPVAAGSPGISVEMERRDGTHLRIQGLNEETLVALSQAFLKERR